jgi:ribokinase
MPSPLQIASLRYDAMVGTGGIGTGSFFALNGDHTLGREESRTGRFLDRRDYCKLHIIAHTVQTLLGPAFATRPIGRVGDDAAGRALMADMREAGLDLRHVRALAGEQTMNCVCFIYPDGSGGNLTVDDSACARVSPADIRAAEADFVEFAHRGIALSVPEVPLAARREILRLGTRHGWLRVAAVTTAEISAGEHERIFDAADLVAMNIDEAAAFAGMAAGHEPARIAEATVEGLQKSRSFIQASMTAGRHGSWVWDGNRLAHLPPFPVTVAGTAGAGDAHLSGLLAGLTAGLSLHDAHALAALAAAVAVTSVHTINPDLDAAAMRRMADSTDVRLPAAVRALLPT